MKICYRCADVFTPDSYAHCPRCARPLAPAEANRWMWSARRWLRETFGRR